MIRVKNLSYIYHKTGKEAIKGIDFCINKGEVFGLLGPSGSGKTTTQKVIIGLLRNYNGEVKILDKHRYEWGSDFFEKIGVAFDFPCLYLKLTARENLNLISKYYKNNTLKEINSLLDKVNLLPYADKKIESFSKGMKMRVNFIRSILHNPDIIFLDEPTNGMDPVNAKIIKNMITNLKGQGKTIFLTTHNMLTADQICDRVAFLIEGKIPIIDSPKNLKIGYSKKIIKTEYLKENEVCTKFFDLQTIGDNNEFFNFIKNNEIKTIHSQEASLEDIFIKLTGKKLG